MKKILSALLSAPHDVIGGAGASLLAYGTWLIYRPAGFIVAGVMLIVAAVLLSRAE